MSDNRPSHDYLVAAIRPGMRKADLSHLPGMTELVRRRPYEATGRFTIGFDENDRVDSVSFLRHFEPEPIIDGLRIGAPLDAALRAFPDLRVHKNRTLPGGDQVVDYRGAQTTDGHEITLVAKDGWILALHLWSRDRFAALEKVETALARTPDQPRPRPAVFDIKDPDQRLDFWAENTLIWGKPAPLQEYAKWLREGDTERWHDAAINWNWDYGVAPMWWIVNQPACDAATALEIFYLNEPFYAGPRPPEEKELLDYVRERWKQGAFRIGEVRFDQPSYVQGYHLHKYDLVPESMRRCLPGRNLATIEYADGLPMHLYNRPIES